MTQYVNDLMEKFRPQIALTARGLPPVVLYLTVSSLTHDTCGTQTDGAGGDGALGGIGSFVSRR
jgi:hypothetical protein